MAAKRDRLFLFTWLLPLLLGFAAALATGTFVYSRFFLYAMPGYLLLLSYGMNALTGGERVRSWVRRGAAAALAALLLPGVITYHRLGKQGLRPAARWIEHHAPGQRVIALGLLSQVFWYYHQSTISIPPGVEVRPETVAASLVVTAHPWSVGRKNQRLLSERCEAPQVFPAAFYQENTVYLYRCY
jgi:hypothetical protein